METKTKIEITQDTNQCQHKKGSKGYIDGYVCAGDGRPYAVVVCGEIIDLVPTWAMKAI